MRQDYSLLFSVAALGLLFSRQQAPASIVSNGPSITDAGPREQAGEGDKSMIQVDHDEARKADRFPFRKAGFSLTELIVFIAVVGVLFVITVPFFISYYQAAAARANVQQVITLFNQARELAIRQNNPVCVTLPSNGQMVLLQGSCAGAAWTGAGTDVAGNINLPQGFTVAPLNSVTFNYLGAAGAATTYTMTNSTTGGMTTISISLTGRVTSP
jgi:Tfp pilus assembly protein FimT